MRKEQHLPIDFPYIPVGDSKRVGLSRDLLYKLRSLGKIQFKYVLSKPFFSVRQLESIMTDEAVTDKDIEKIQTS
jgi:hypothetical protein